MANCLSNRRDSRNRLRAVCREWSPGTDETDHKGFKMTAVEKKCYERTIKSIMAELEEDNLSRAQRERMVEDLLSLQRAYFIGTMEGRRIA